MIKEAKLSKKEFILHAEFKSKKQTKDVICKQNYVTEFIKEKTQYIFLGEKKKFDIEAFKSIAGIIISSPRVLQVDVKSFITDKLSEVEIVRVLTEAKILLKGDVFTLKTKKKEKVKDTILVELTAPGKEQLKVSKEDAEARNWTRSFQIMPPNKLNSVNFANKIKAEFAPIKNVKVKVLGKKAIEKNKMGLFLGVNAGSAHEPRLVVLEYKGNPQSKEKTAYIGKGIMFDSGGYSLKPSNYMKTMKFDMSGAAVVAGAMKLIAKRKPKSNISVVMPLTDNMIGSKAQTVDSVQTSMSGKTVEINNTDAEGRLVLADSITYAIKKLKATRILDVATLTGAVVVCFDTTYSACWTTDDNDWNKMNEAAKDKGELIWRMPFHKDYLKGFKESKIADLLNANYTSQAGSSAAGMFLKEFTEDVPFIHFDIAGTDQIKGIPTGVLVKTLAEFAHKIK